MNMGDRRDDGKVCMGRKTGVNMRKMAGETRDHEDECEYREDRWEGG